MIPFTAVILFFGGVQKAWYLLFHFLASSSPHLVPPSPPASWSFAPLIPSFTTHSLTLYCSVFKMLFNTFSASALLITSVLATPIPSLRQAGSAITPAQLTQIAPALATCNPAAQFADECRNAEQAAPLLNGGFDQFGITSVGEKAAILSLLMFESGNFAFDKNHFPAPGRPGQGTRNLMMFPFVYQYAVDTPETSAAALALVPNDAAAATASADTMNAVRELVLKDDLSFASGMWFYKASGPSKTGCAANQAIVDGLVAETVEGWSNFITNCISTTVTPERQTVWEATLKALKGQ
ncbi:hypothetical protein DL96DRAFT_1587412 [Flagelloscypha sp. PMI_526]|nr:hypothetical protein DL96DRAFT_1587412 [Flagelloscypha sp. PMI_526]